MVIVLPCDTFRLDSNELTWFKFPLIPRSRVSEATLDSDNIMCRLFGFRSHTHLSVHHTLVAAENALVVQSLHHPDGWGVAYFEDGTPILHKATKPAFRDEGFGALCRGLTSQTLIAHIRQATVGGVHIANTHPFQHGKWIFAHNGTIFGFSQLRPFFLEEIAPHLRPLIQGSTDSEHCFFLFLSELEALADLEETTSEDLEDALCASMQKIASWCRLLGIRQAPCMNFMVTNGKLFACTRLGRDLYFSTDKPLRADSHHPDALNALKATDEQVGLMPVLASSIASALSESSSRPSSLERHVRERKQPGLAVGHLLVASERISAEDTWEEVPNNAILLLDAEMRFRVRREVANLTQLEFSPMPVSLHREGIAS